MKSKFTNRTPLNEALSETALILTPNQPLAQQLRRIRLQQHNCKVDRGGQIQVLSAWLQSSLREHLTAPLATDLQLRSLMQQALEQSQKEFPDLNPTTLAPQALNAWRNLKRYQTSDTELKQAEVGQQVKFANTVNAFERLLSSAGMTTIETEIEKQLLTPPLPQPSTNVNFYAFIEPPPPLILAWVSRLFIEVTHLDYATSDDAHCSLQALPDEDTELTAAAQWAAQALSDDKRARVGIIYRDLGKYLDKVQRILRAQLPADTTFSASIQPSASQLGGIQAALGLLKLNLYEISHSDARFIIHTPFWGDASTGDEYEARARWDKDFCALRQRNIRPEHLWELLKNTDQSSEPAAETDGPGASSKSILARTLDFSQRRRRASDTQTALEWAVLFQRQLDLLGWGDAIKRLAHQRLAQLWYDKLRDFADLGAVSGPLRANDALALLQRCCDSRETDPGAAHAGVRVLDTVEGAADFTHVWIVGVDQTRWPGVSMPNPLLPIRLQAAANMPGADIERETQLASALIARVLTSGDQVVVSFPEKIDDIEQKPSALLPKTLTLAESIAAKNNSEATKTDKFNIELVNTAAAPGLLAHEKETRGGAALIKTMLASPFDAFATWRLQAEPLPEPTIGLDAAQRGTLMHMVLDSIWSELKSFERLTQTSDEDCYQLCLQAAANQLRSWQARHGWLSKVVAELETERLVSTAADWLNFERNRTPFEILSAEEDLTAELGGLRFRLRMDRLDRLADGAILLMDYKTGQQLARTSWDIRQISEPQLPIYAISMDQPPDAICFAKVRTDEMKLIGIGRESLDVGIQKIEDWDSQIEQWRTTLTDIAARYASGDAIVCETKSAFNQQDPLMPLHRFCEYETLQAWLAQSDRVSATEPMEDSADE